VQAVVHAGTAPFVAQSNGASARQTSLVVEWFEQQQTTVADDVASVKCSLHHAAPKLCKLNVVIGALWHRQSSLVIGVECR
jgi:hypothetical protein